MEGNKKFTECHYALDDYTQNAILSSLERRLHFTGLEDEGWRISDFSEKSFTLKIYPLTFPKENIGYIEVNVDREMIGWTIEKYDGTVKTLGMLQFPKIIVDIVVAIRNKKWIQKVNDMPETDIHIEKWGEYGYAWARYTTTLPYDPVGTILKVANILKKANQLYKEEGEKQ